MSSYTAEELVFIKFVGCVSVVGVVAAVGLLLLALCYRSRR